MARKQLIIRLSSLGDIILATSSLEVASHQKPDWLVLKEYSEILLEHPKIGKTILFNKKLGLKGWIRLCREVYQKKYDFIFDLHCNLRTRIMYLCFRFWSLQKNSTMPKWRSVSKGRLRLNSYFIFKKALPKVFRPHPWVQRYSQALGGTGEERPDLRYLVVGKSLPDEIVQILESQESYYGGYYCIMPSSKWDGKKWPVDYYFQMIRKLSYFPVILGTQQDHESNELARRLNQAKIFHINGVGKWNLKDTAVILKHSKGYIGSDTGLAHLAEAVGTSANVIFGPTTADMGFGPWMKTSKSIEKPIFCKPCSKDGRYCYFIFNKYSCLKSLSPEAVIENLKC